jgi:hypothetical protein
MKIVEMFVRVEMWKNSTDNFQLEGEKFLLDEINVEGIIWKVSF